MTDSSFARAEMDSVLAFGDADDFRVKLTSDAGETKWMRISRDQAERIGEILTDDDKEQCGFICKRCGGPCPVGIGYVDESAGAAERSAGLLACACGWSVTPCPQCESGDDRGDGRCERHGKWCRR